MQIWQVGLEEELMDVGFDPLLDWGEKFLEWDCFELELDSPLYWKLGI